MHCVVVSWHVFLCSTLFLLWQNRLFGHEGINQCQDAETQFDKQEGRANRSDANYEERNAAYKPLQFELCYCMHITVLVQMYPKGAVEETLYAT
jgi:hypothetical protein